jgi:hypothetical protein
MLVRPYIKFEISSTEQDLEDLAGFVNEETDSEEMRMKLHRAIKNKEATLRELDRLPNTRTNAKRCLRANQSLMKMRSRYSKMI